MARVTNAVSARNRHKKILKQASGYYGARSRTYRTGYQSIIKAGQYAYRDRRQKKRVFRQLWISRINSTSRQYELSYNQLINGLNKSSIYINRKMLSEVAMFDKTAFLMYVNKAKQYLKSTQIKSKTL